MRASKKATKKKRVKYVNFDDTKTAFHTFSDRELLRAFWLFRIIGNPFLGKWGPRLASISLRMRLPVKGLVKATVFQQFCGGESIDECQSRIDLLSKKGVGTILDFASEGKDDEQSLDDVVDETLRAIDLASSNKAIGFAVFKPTGVARLKLLEKRDAGVQLNAKERQEFKRVVGRFEKICSYASEKSVRILIDAEESWIQNSVDEIAQQMMHNFNKRKVIVYTTLQMYRHDRLAYLKDLHEKARKEQFLIGVKLVRGAYLEKENRRAELMSYPTPIQSSKEATDRDYNSALRYIVKHYKDIAICAGTHNETSTRLLVKLMQDAGIEPINESFFFSQLLGMSENLTYILASKKYNVCKYVPYGPIQDLIPYLSRRAEENSAMKGQTSREAHLIESELQRRGVLRA